MSLHDRIMAINVQGDRKRADVRADAAQLAKEADELMAEMAEELAYYTDDVKTAAVWKKYKAWKESTK